MQTRVVEGEEEASGRSDDELDFWQLCKKCIDVDMIPSEHGNEDSVLVSILIIRSSLLSVLCTE